MVKARAAMNVYLDTLLSRPSRKCHHPRQNLASPTKLTRQPEEKWCLACLRSLCCGLEGFLVCDVYTQEE